MTNFVTVEAREIRQAMRVVCAVVERRNTIPILSHVLLTHDANGLHITGTDLDIEIEATVGVIEGKGKWQIAVDAKRLANIAAVGGVMPMKIVPGEDNKAAITLDEAASYLVNTLPADDFPIMQGERADVIETFSNGSLAALFNKVKWCISTEETRYYLNGIAWQFRKDGSRFVATDGHKLAACRYATAPTATAVDMIIPRKLVGIITTHLKNADVKIFAIKDSVTRLDIVSPGISIRSKLIDGKFPDWSRVVPAKVEHSFKINRGEIITAVQQAIAIGSDRVRGIRFAPDKGRAVIEHKAVDFGSASIKTSVEWSKGMGAFGFNHSYFLTVASNCQGDFEIGGACPASPFVFKDSDETMTRVMMPMRV